MWLALLKKLLPTLIGLLASWIKARAEKPPEPKPEPKPTEPEKPKPEPQKPEPKPTEPEPPTPPKPEPEKPKPEPQKPPEPEYDDGTFAIPVREAFFGRLWPSSDGKASIRHKDGQVVLIGTRVGDDLFIDNYYLQKIGTTRISMRFNTGGERVLRVQRDGVTIASLPISVTY